MESNLPRSDSQVRIFHLPQDCAFSVREEAKLETWLHYLLVMRPQASCLTFVSHSFSSCEMGIIRLLGKIQMRVHIKLIARYVYKTQKFSSVLVAFMIIIDILVQFMNIRLVFICIQITLKCQLPQGKHSDIYQLMFLTSIKVEIIL